MPATPPETIAGHLRTMADDIENFGLWAGSPNFIDVASEALDVPAAAYKATAGSLPFLFAIPTWDASEQARAYIERTPAAMDVLTVLAAYLATVKPWGDWTDDPIDRLSAWPHLLGTTEAEIPQTLRDLALSLTADAPAPAAA
jgi:hypothetical protein